MTTRDKIISAAIKNFLTFGYEKTSLASIAEEVGIKKPSIYHHFKNKEELFYVSLNHILESLKHKIKNSINNSSTSKEMLESLISTLIEFHIQLSYIVNKNNFKLINMFCMLYSTVDNSEKTKKAVNDYYDFLKDIIMDILSTGQMKHELRKDIKKDSISEQIIAWFEGLLTFSSLYSSFNINTAKQDFLDNIWKLLSDQSKPKKSFFGRRSHPKTISLGTKW